jgi:hypothetical protein
MPRKFRQAPIDSDGTVRITVGDYEDLFAQDDDPVQAPDPPVADTYPPRVRP